MLLICCHIIPKNIDFWNFLVEEQKWYSKHNLDNTNFYYNCDNISGYKDLMNDYYSQNSDIYTIYYYSNQTVNNNYKNIINIDINDSQSPFILKKFFENINFLNYVKLEPHHDLQVNSLNNSMISIKQINTIYRLFGYTPTKKSDRILWATKLIVPNFIDILPNNNFLLTRYGSVELHVIEKYTFCKDELKKYWHENIHKFTSHDNDTIIPNSGTRNEPLLNLMTNAGFYVTDKQHDFSILEYFCEKYIKGISNSHYMQRCDSCYHSNNLLSKVYTNWKNKYFSITFRKDIYKLIARKTILVVSPFTEKINKQYISGNMFKLYNDIEIPSFKIRTLYTPITIYGNPVDKSWKDTFNKTCKKIRNVIETFKDIDVVIPSCGCYGIPICDYVYTELNTSALYLGNLSHNLYGILQKRTVRTSPPNIRNEEFWIKNNNLNHIKNLEKIDNGSYIF